MASHKKAYIIDLAILIIVAVVLAITMAWSSEIELELGLSYYKEVEVEANATLNAGKRSADGELKVHFFDIGQGDCAVIELPDGKNVIIDAGSGTSSSGSNATINSTLNFISDTLGDDFKYFDYAILTHPDSDHCNVLDDVLNKYPSYVCYRPNVEATNNGYLDPGKTDLASAVPKSSAVYKNAIAAMYKPTAAHDFTPTVYITDPTDEAQTISGGEGDDAYSLNFYSPLSKNYGTKESNAEWNNYSPVMVLEYRGFKFVMTGDAEKDNLGEFVAKVNAAKTDGVSDKYDVFTDSFCANVIKAGHHGSENATTTDFLEVMTSPAAVGSTYSVISCGTGNSYGHPHAAALNRITGVGIKQENILRTDEIGNIGFTVKVDEEGNYNLYYGDTATPEPDPTPTPTPDPEPTPQKVKILVYNKLWSIDLKWPVVAWTCYAVLVVLVALHAAYIRFLSGGRRKGGSH